MVECAFEFAWKIRSDSITDFYLANEMEFLQPTSPEFTSDQHYCLYSETDFQLKFSGYEGCEIDVYYLGICKYDLFASQKDNACFFFRITCRLYVRRVEGRLCLPTLQ